MLGAALLTGCSSSAASPATSSSSTAAAAAGSPAANAGVQSRKIKDKAAAQAFCEEIAALPALSSLLSEIGVSGAMDVQSDYAVAPEGFTSSNQIGTLYCQAAGSGNSLWTVALDWWRDAGVYQKAKSNDLLMPASADAGVHGQLAIDGKEGAYSYTPSTPASGGLYQGITFPADLTRITVNFKAPDGADINDAAAHDALVPIVELLSSVSREGK